MDANTGVFLAAVVLNMAGIATLLINARTDKARELLHRQWEVADRLTLKENVRDVKTELVSRDDKATQKLDHIEKLTNSTMDALKEKLAASQKAEEEAVRREEALYDRLAVALARIDSLETLLKVKLGVDDAKKDDDDGA